MSKTSERFKKIKELGWIGFFFLVLAVFTLPTIFLSRHYAFDITMVHQAIIVMMTTWVCERVRGGSITEISGRFDSGFIRNTGIGLMMGCLLMVAPSLILLIGGWVHWEVQSVEIIPLLPVMASITAGAIAEEFLFRGFIFQRLLSFGVWPAQLLISAYFLLTHMANPEMTVDVKMLAMTNIFLASVLFGITVIQTKSLAMAIALHTAANLTQGVVLGFGVSGHQEQSIIRPIISDAPQWLTGGGFGLEGSLPGLLSVIVLLVIFLYRKTRIQLLNEEAK